MDEQDIDDFEIDLDIEEVEDEPDDIEEVEEEPEEEPEEEDIEEEEEAEEIEEDVEDVEDDVEDVEDDIEDDIETDVVISNDVDDEGANFNDYFSEDAYVNKPRRRFRSIQRFSKQYKDTMRIKQQFDNISPYLREQILNELIAPSMACQFASVCSGDKNELYQLCGKLIQKEFSYADLLDELSNKVSCWNSKTYKSQQDIERQELDVMTVKLSVSEGLYQCNRCKSKKTFSRQVQTRSADEGMTSIIQCSECSKVWKEYA
jgi:DNA-directed RNA polymerase subunit M/transcription elongation factor TFIIS